MCHNQRLPQAFTAGIPVNLTCVHALGRSYGMLEVKSFKYGHNKEQAIAGDIIAGLLVAYMRTRLFSSFVWNGLMLA